MSRLCLAFDTSSAVTAVALTRGDRVLAEDATPSQERHAQLLLPRIEACLLHAGHTLSQVELFAVGIGPGSFTGVRVGLATAKGFALATGKPLVGVVSLAALARAAADGGGLIAPVLDAYKGEVFAALYRLDAAGGMQPVLAPFNAPPAEAAHELAQVAGQRLCVLGAGFRRYEAEMSAALGDHTVLAPALDVPRASLLAFEAERVLSQAGPSDAASLVPLYVRGSDAQLPKTPLAL